MRCDNRPAACYRCPFPDCICDAAPTELEAKLNGMIDRDPQELETVRARHWRTRRRKQDYYRERKQQKAEYAKRYREEHREQMRARQRLWYQQNRERLLAEQRKARKVGLA